MKEPATPRPWKYNPDNGHELITNKQGDDICVVSFPMVRSKGYDSCAQEQTANAKLIIKSVNNHQALVNCIEDAIRYFKEHNIDHNIVRQLEVALENVDK